jgi:hypothetical protein
MAKPQRYDNHARYFPPFHFIAFPILAIHLIVRLVDLVKGPSLAAAWEAVVAFGLVTIAFAARYMALRVQDRVIRLEERLRLSKLLPADQALEIGQLSTRQVIALRFARDDEVPELVRRVRSGELAEPDDIKRAIRVWRPDTLRA